MALLFPSLPFSLSHSLPVFSLRLSLSLSLRLSLSSSLSLSLSLSPSLPLLLSSSLLSPSLPLPLSLSPSLPLSLSPSSPSLSHVHFWSPSRFHSPIYSGTALRTISREDGQRKAVMSFLPPSHSSQLRSIPQRYEAPAKGIRTRSRGNLSRRQQ